MDILLAAIEQSAAATALRFSRWGYAGVNAAHILGIALLVGSIIPMDLRLLGAWPHIPRSQLARVLVPVAICGLCIAICTGLLLFSVRASEYASLMVFWVKMALVIMGAGSAITLHAMHGWWLADGPQAHFARAGALSILCWLGALTAGRLIAFMGS